MRLEKEEHHMGLRAVDRDDFVQNDHNLFSYLSFKHSWNN